MRSTLRVAGVGARRFSTSAKRINLNADLAEGYGPWTMTADEDLLQIVTTANVACGGHAGDANIMAAVLERAAAHGVSVGAHPGYDDKPGFGRRVCSRWNPNPTPNPNQVPLTMARLQLSPESVYGLASDMVGEVTARPL